MLVPTQLTTKTTALPTLAKAAVVTACVTVVPTVLLTLGAVAAGFLVPLATR